TKKQQSVAMSSAQAEYAAVVAGCCAMVYQNFLREFQSTTIAFDPFPSTDEPEKRPLKEFLIKFSAGTTPPLNKSTLSSSFSDPSKVTYIELTAHMIAINNQRDSVSPPPLAAKPKKRKSQTVALTLPKSQGPEASGALFKKSKRPKSKKPPTETKDCLPHLMKALVNQNLYLRVLLLIPKTQGETNNPLTPDEGTAKTMLRPEGSLGDKDSGGNIPPADMKPRHNPVADPSGIDKESDEEEVLAAGDDMDEDPQDDAEVRTPSPDPTQPESSHVQESASDSSSPDLNLTHPSFLLSDDELDKESDEEEVLAAGDDMDEDPQDDAEVRTPSPDPTQPEPSHV
ncbi:hypothetical protein Tco_0737540, partial [Tanacetum coccineum]